MAIKYRLYGVNSISMGACGNNGGMGISLTAVDKLRRESVEFTKEAPDTFELEIEESTAPDFEAIADGKPFVLTFDTYNVTPSNMALAFGGTAATTSKKWSAAVLDAITEKSVEIKTKPVEGYYMKIEIPRASITAQLVAPLKRTDAGSIRFIVKALVPQDGSGVLLAPVVMTLTVVT